jgi:hypothetical protein
LFERHRAWVPERRALPKGFGVILRRFLAGLLSPFALVNLTGPSSGAETEFPGLEIFTHEDQDTIGKDAAGLRFAGQITAALATALEKVLLDNGKPRFARLMLELDSEGGELDAVEKVVAVLQKVQTVATLSTRVMDGKVCASGCVAVFMTGKERKASTASVWVFHGACSLNTNVPSMAATSRYLDLLTNLGVRPEFTCKLVQEGYVTSPGAFILSGYELFHNHDSGIITELLPNWRPEEPRGVWFVVPR